MNAAADLLTFAGVMALAQFSPGPDMILLTRTALKNGARAGVEMALGIACGLAVHTAVAVGGLALVFERFPGFGQSLRWAAAGYLLWLAFRIFQETFVSWQSGGLRQDIDRTSPRKPFVRGLICNLLNPKAALVLAAVCAPFLKGDRPDWWPLALWGIVVGQGCVLWSLWAGALQWRPLAGLYRKLERGIDLLFAVVLAALAFGLMLG
jgi:threonine efflux protein